LQLIVSTNSFLIVSPVTLMGQKARI